MVVYAGVNVKNLKNVEGNVNDSSSIECRDCWPEMQANGFGPKFILVCSGGEHLLFARDAFTNCNARVSGTGRFVE